jgi:hypothetical protein
MDDEDHYLLSAHLGPRILYVIDVRTNALVKAIPGVPGITGVEYVPGLHKAYTWDWGEEKIGVVDLRSSREDPRAGLHRWRMGLELSDDELATGAGIEVSNRVATRFTRSSRLSLQCPLFRELSSPLE